MTESKDRLQDKNTDESSAPTSLFLKYRRALILLAHIFTFAASLFLSFLFVANMQFRKVWLVEQYPAMLTVVMVVKLTVFGLSKQYRGWWRYVGISDLFAIFRASLISTIVIIGSWWLFLAVPEIRRIEQFEAFKDISQAVFLLDMFGTILILAGLRMAIRLYHEEFRTVESARLKKLLIVGAGNAGEALLREIHRMTVAQYDATGFVDDDLAKKGINIHGLPVLGTVEQLPEICEKHAIDEIAIAIPSASHKQLRRVIQVCEGAKIRFRTVPSITDIASGKFRVSQIRDVDINDLLGRKAVQLRYIDFCQM